LHQFHHGDDKTNKTPAQNCLKAPDGLPHDSSKCSVVFGSLAATDSGILLHPVLSTLANTETLVSEDEVPNIRTNEDTNDNVSIVVHGQQHDKVRDRELQHVQQGADCLLQYTWAEARCNDEW
jgi:hypothetical protein